MNLRELMRKEKAKRATEKTSSSSSSFEEHSKMNICTVNRSSVSSSHQPLQVSKISSGVMTGYESDDEADGTETDGSVNSRPSCIPIQQKLRNRLEFERYGREAEDGRRIKKQRYEDPDHGKALRGQNTPVLIVSHASTLVSDESERHLEKRPLQIQTDDESNDSGYDAELEGVGKRRKSLPHFKTELEIEGLPSDFFDVNKSEDVEMQESEEEVVVKIESEPSWVKRALNHENWRIEEEYILEDEGSDEEVMEQTNLKGENVTEKRENVKEKRENVKDGTEDKKENLKKPESYPEQKQSSNRNWVDAVFDGRLGLGVGDESDDEHVEESIESYKQTAQYSIEKETLRKSVDAAVSDNNTTSLPEGFFEDPEKDAKARGEVAPSVRQHKELEQEFRMFQRELGVVEQQQESLRHIKEVDRQLGADADMVQEIEDLQLFVSRMKERRKNNFQLAKHEEHEMIYEDESSDDAMDDGPDVNELIDISWRNRRIIR